MRQFYATVTLLCAVGIHGLRRGFNPPLTLEDRHQACKNICSRHGRMTAEERECMTSCRVKVDLGSEDANRLEDFAKENKTRLRRYEEHTGQNVKPCKPPANVEEVHFADVDLNNDKIVTRHELTAFTDMLCIPQDLANKMFDDADRNHDESVTTKEWNSSGEDTQIEYEVDKFADKHVEPKKEAPEDVARNALKDLVGEVKAPAFEDMDKDNDGKITEWELSSFFMWEAVRRNTQMDGRTRRHLQENVNKVMADKFKVLDKDGDHFLSREEYKARKSGENFGHEILEAVMAVSDAE
mmetsp:Transcript_102645/g.203767  ORF Transcript_102645/g.203767 Transcript_102645/m.203767 type:complete len:297 (+) Transcript_102645:44-934(+)